LCIKFGAECDYNPDLQLASKQVQKSIAASPHVLIEGDPCLGNALVGKKKKLLDGNLKAQTLQITNKDAIHPSPDQPDFSKENSEGNLPSLSHDDGLDGNHHGQITTNQAFTSNPTVTPLPTPATSGNKQNNWRVNPPQNQWLVPVMSPSEGLVYKPYTGPCPPAGSLLTPFYANVTPLSLPSTPYGVHMPHQQQYMAPPGTPAMPMNYFPPFTLPVMNPATPASAVEQGSQAAASQPNGNVLSRISCNMSNLSGIWKFYAPRDSEPQASSASSPSDRLRGDGNGPVSFFAAASVQHAQPQPSSGSRDKQGNVIKVVPHNAQTASESAARIFQSIQMERQQSDL
jgi:protein EARLY FLOWERING 3